MTFKKISFVFLLLLPFLASADYVAFRYFYRPQNVTTGYQSESQTFSDADYIPALEFAYTKLPLKISQSTGVLSFDLNGYVAVSNATSTTLFRSTQSYFQRYTSLCSLVSAAISRNYVTASNVAACASFSLSSGTYYLRNVSPEEFFDNVFKLFTASQLAELVLSIPAIQSDVSALVPLVASNRDVNAGIALDFKVATTNAQYQRSEIINDLSTIINSRLLSYTVDYDIPQIRDDIRALVSVNPSAATSDNNAMALEYFDLLGFDYSTDQAALVQAMINAGLATDNNDALAKLSSNTWRRNTLGPYVQAQRKKRDLIAQARQAGITQNFDGRALDALANPELESLLQYSFNTPASSNATIHAHALDSLKSIDNNMVDAAGDVRSIAQRMEGPLEVNVMNWPDDWLANSVSNALDGVFSGLLDGITNFNPHYTFDDDTFFSRNLYSWRGFGQSALDQTEQNPVERDSAIGVTSFEFNPTGDFFQDVPNLLAMQSLQGADLANIFATVAIHVQSNAQEQANTDALAEQYQEELAQLASEALDDFQSMLHYSNLLSNVQFTDTHDLLELPEGFKVFSGDWAVPEYVNLELPSWDFQQPNTDGNNPPTRGQVNPGNTITIDTTQYRSFFQNVRYASLTLYWGLLLYFVFVLFRIFKAFVGIIPRSLTGNFDPNAPL